MRKRSNYVEFFAFGARLPQFVDELLINSVWDIEYLDGGVSGKIIPRGYCKIARAGRALGVRTRAMKRHGIVFFLNRYRKRSGIIVGGFALFAIIAALSVFVWDIKIEGNDRITDGQLLEVLAANGLEIGSSRFAFDPNGIEYDLLLTLNDLAWVSVELHGSRVNVKISERQTEEAPEIPLNTPCNVIAAHSGVIVETEVYRGTQLLFKTSGVKKGDTIVSGIVDDGGGNNLLLHADAKIVAEYEEKIELYRPYTTTERVRYSTERKDYFKFLGMSFPLFFGGVDDKNASYEVITQKCTLFGFPLPWKKETVIYEHFHKKEITRSPEDTMKQLNEQLSRCEQSFFKDAEIIASDYQYHPDENGIAVIAAYTIRENIAKLQEIQIKSQ